MTTPAATPLTPEQARIIAERKAALVAAVEDRLPESSRRTRSRGRISLFNIRTPLVLTIKTTSTSFWVGQLSIPVGIHGKELRIHGKNRETLDQV